MTPATSLADRLRASTVGAPYPLDYRLECAACGGLLELRYAMDVMRREGPALLVGSGLWRYAPVLPIADPAHRVTLGEGRRRSSSARGWPRRSGCAGCS